MAAEDARDAGGSVASHDHPARSGPEDGPFILPLLEREAARVRIVPDLLPAVSVLSLLSLTGIVLGWVWSRLAPATGSELGPDGALVPLLVESYHEFDALAIFLMLSAAFGAVSGAVVWAMRARRGPVVLVAAVLGSAVAAWLAITMGESFAAQLYPMPRSVRPGDLIADAPRVETLWAVVAQPLALSLTYGLAASWNGLDDLGRRLR